MNTVKKSIFGWERTHPCVLDAEREQSSTGIQVDLMRRLLRREARRSTQGCVRSQPNALLILLRLLFFKEHKAGLHTRPPTVTLAAVGPKIVIVPLVAVGINNCGASLDAFTFESVNGVAPVREVLIFPEKSSGTVVSNAGVCRIARRIHIHSRNFLLGIPALVNDKHNIASKQLS